MNPRRHKNLPGMPLLSLIISAMMFGSTVAAQPFIQGIVEAADETVLSSEMAGRINRLPVDEGDHFKKGDILVRFACDILEAEKTVSEAIVKGVRAKYDNTKRLDSLGSAGALDLALTKSGLEEALAEQNVIVARIKQCSVRAPFDGLVLSQDIQAFESVNVMTPLLKIGRNTALRLMIIVPARWLRWIKPGAKFKFVIEAEGTTTSGQIAQIGAAVDPTSQTVKLEGILGSAPGRHLVPGVGGSVIFADLPRGVE